MSKHPQKPTPDYALLEDRTLYSATPIDPALLDPNAISSAESSTSVDPFSNLAAFEQLVIEATESGMQDSSAYGVNSPVDEGANATNSTEEIRNELIFLDSRVSDFESLLNNILSDAQDPDSIEVFLLDADRDGIEQVNAILSDYTNLDAIHFVVEGNGNSIQLGSSWLDTAVLKEREGELSNWASALSADGNLLFHGSGTFASSDDIAVKDTIDEIVAESYHSTIDNDPMATDVRRELILLQEGVHDLESLVADIYSQSTADREFEVVYLNRLESGFDQLDRLLAGYDDLDAIHLVSHGSNGMIQLGGSWLTAENIESHSASLQRWGMSLDPNGDILIYGCDVASGAEGRELIDTIARLTDAEVAASDDLTGLADLGGDWDLEFSIGTIDSELAFTHQVVEYWHGTLDLTALESEVLVNGSTASNQFVNAETGGTIAMDSSGRYVVTWFDNRSGNDDVYARVYNADGTARTAEFMVHASNSSAQDWCSVSMADNGNFVVTWSDNRSGNYEVYMRLFNVDGTALTAETLVSSRTGIQDYHAVDMASDGSFVVAFLDQNVNDIYFQRYNSSGVAQGSNTLAHTTTANTQNRPDIAVNNDGSFIVTWTSQNQDTTTSLGVYARTFNASGTATSGEILINQTTAGDQTYSSIDSDSSGNFVVSWESGTDIYARRFNASGTALGNEILVNTYTSGTQTFSHVDMNANGDFVVAWQENNGKDGSGVGVFAQQLDSTGTRIGGEVQVASTTLNSQNTVSVAYSGSSLAFTWGGNGTGDSTGIFARRFSAQNFSTLTVSTTSDTADGATSSIAALLENRGADGQISLREAILATNNSANGSGGADRILFSIGSGSQTISITGSNLADITQAVVIDGSTQTGYTNAPLISIVDGDTRTTGLTLASGSSGSTIRGLNIQGFGTSAITVISSNNTIVGNYIGTNAAGTAAAANYDGINIWSGDNNVIGGTGANDRNVISGQTNNGIVISGGADNTQVLNNYIGLNVAGTSSIANGVYGIWAGDSVGLTIGGTSSSQRNVISGNGFSGIYFSNIDNSTVYGNYIGTNAAGTGDINGTGADTAKSGIILTNGSSGNQVGNTIAGARNIISGTTTMAWRFRGQPRSTIPSPATT